MSPRMVGPCGLLLLWGAAGEGLGGVCSHGLVLYGVGEHHRGAPKCPPAPHWAALAVSGRQRMLRGALTAAGVKGEVDTRGAGMPRKAEPAGSSQMCPHPGAAGSWRLCLSCPSCPRLVASPTLWPLAGSLAHKSRAMAVRPLHEKVPGECAGPLCQAALLRSGAAVGA